MKFGTGLPLIANLDRVAVRDFAQALDGAGFDFIGLGGHVLAAEPNRFPERPNFTYVGPFYDPFVLFSFLAGVTERLHFLSSVLILPEMPAMLVAKQAAELSLVSDGRFELGVGISWNSAEYQALGQSFADRGSRMEEQIQVLRRIWAEPFVSFEGRWHNLDRVGLNRQPITIPIWIGCGSEDKLLRRVAKFADGWLPQGDPVEPMTRLRGYLEAEGRSISDFRLAGRVVAGPEDPEAWISAASSLKSSGATHLNLGAPPGTQPAQALEMIIEARAVLAVLSDALGD